MSKRLLFLSGLAILMIVIQHATAYGLQAMFEWTTPSQAIPVSENPLYNSLSYYLTMTLRQLAVFSVPAFLFISGFFVAFMARGKDSVVTFKTMTPRIKILLPPFVIWTVIRFALLRNFPESIEEILQPYHFVPLLIQFYLLAPFLIPIARKRPVLLLGGVAALQLGVQYFRYVADLGIEMTGVSALIAETPRWIFIGQQPFWFPLGLVFGLHFPQISPRLIQAKWKLLAATAVFAVLAVVEYLWADKLNGEAWIGPSFAGFMRNFYILFAILTFISFDVASGALTRYINDIGSQSLGIYLANIPSIYVSSVLMYHLTPWALEIQVLYQTVLVIVGLMIPLILMWIMKSSTALRPTYRYIFG